jgi:hypothetical protein
MTYKLLITHHIYTFISIYILTKLNIYMTYTAPNTPLITTLKKCIYTHVIPPQYTCRVSMDPCVHCHSTIQRREKGYFRKSVNSIVSSTISAHSALITLLGIRYPREGYLCTSCFVTIHNILKKEQELKFLKEKLKDVCKETSLKRKSPSTSPPANEVANDDPPAIKVCCSLVI